MKDTLRHPVQQDHAPVPIVFVHQHYSFYLEFTLRQAKQNNADSCIWLIGDSDNDRFSFINHIPIKALADADYHRFHEVYVHSSPNTEDYERFCFGRWFLLRALMNQYDYPVAFLADTDVMIYDQLGRMGSRVLETGSLAAFNFASDCDWVYCASGHSSIWTREGIDQFCTFILKLYTDPAYQALLDGVRAEGRLNNSWVGLSDMTALYFFMKQHADRILNVSRCDAGQIFDHNFGTATNYDLYEYALTRGHKQVQWSNQKRPVCFNRLTNEPVQMTTLHFQGSSKKFIHRHYTGRDLRWLRLLRESRLQAILVYQWLTHVRRQATHRIGGTGALESLRRSLSGKVVEREMMSD